MKYSINAQGAPDAIGPYSQGTTAGRLVFASGQLPVSPDDGERLVDGGITSQTERVIDIIEAILGEVGCTLADVAQTTVYLSSLSDMEAMNEVYARRFPSPAPARAVVGVSELPMGALVEMDCVACR
ncbi:MAG TPA: Rid family detoxifying hydrolase [Candidatus Olsenella avicola]|uniref:RidA family protein n=1 Tax=Olsenella sp. An285 TaxID=1965621 RepID=UPI000B397521|nr:Rid family detoxifying hydrolase [Olsenella sp. An285]OUO46144.1 reactive intermediate/imine deaminase [Olsenella sp. An285]HIY51126.1 Rid family detoxifying hydrolase [Candidatus Olsenella avicola]